jgi:hypothetical protein
MIGSAIGLLALCLVAPLLARLAEAAVPILVALVVFVGLARLVWPSRPRRR